MLSQTSWTKGSRTGLLFFTGGVLVDVWVGVWYYTIIRSENQVLSPTGRFWIIGLFLTGMTFIAIGILQGAIARGAQKSEENLAQKASQDLAKAQASTAAAGIPAVVPPNSAAATPQMPVQPVAAAPNQVPMSGADQPARVGS